MAAQTPLDRIDFGLLEALQEDARLSNKELAARVGLAPSSCLERVRRLRRLGVLRGQHARVDPAALGIGLEAMLAVRIRSHSRDELGSFQEHVLALREVANVFHVSGSDDFLVHVVVSDAHHLRELVLEEFTARPEVAHMETHLVFSHTAKPVLPGYAAAEASEDPAVSAG
jgi:DNA-binding Lrp family transcriptional regulator